MKRAVGRFILLAVLLLVLALTERSAERYFTAGVAYGSTALQPYANVPDNRYGINAFLDQDVYDWQLQRDFSAIQAGGFGWVRQEFIWDQIEPDAKGNHFDTKNQVDAWAKWDRIVADAQQYHVQLIVRLDYAPAWATAGNPDSGQCPTLCPPPNEAQDFAAFAGAVARRYKGKIAAYQVWNEPNLQHEWAGKPISPAGYTALLKAGYMAIKAADPAALILSAALAPNRGDSPANMADPMFLQGMYAAGARPYFDVLGANAYGLNYPAFNRRLGFHSTDFPRAMLPNSDSFTFDRLLVLHQIMAAHGDGGKAVWISEFGWMALPAGWRGNPSPWSQVPAAVRVDDTVAAWQRAAVEWPWVGPLSLWYLRSPSAINPRDPTPYFAILGQDWQPTPLYQAIKAQATAPAQATTGLYPATGQAAIYGPHGFAEAWQHAQSGSETLVIAGAPGANMAFRFSGNALWLRVNLGPQGGMARITVDNVAGLAGALPTNAAGDRILDTYAATLRPDTPVEIASDLPLQSHELELEVLPVYNTVSHGTNVALAGFGVTIAKPAIWSYLKALLGGGAVLLLLWPGIAAARWAWEGPHPSPSPTGRGAFDEDRRPAARRIPVPLSLWERGWGGVPALLANDRVIFSLWIIVTALFYLSPLLSLSLAAAGLLLLLGVARPDLGVLLAPVVVALEFLPKYIHGTTVSLSDVVIGVCGAGWLVRCYWQRRLLLARGPFLPLALAFLAVAFVSLFAAAEPRYSLRDYRAVIAEPVLYFIVVTALLSPRHVKRLVGVAVAGGVGVAGASLFAYALHRGVVTTEGVTRLGGLYPSPDNLALYLDRPLALAGGLALWSSGRLRRLCLLACLPMALAIVLTFTKGAWVALVVTAFLAGLLINRRLLLLAGAAVALTVAGALLTHAPRLISLFSFGAASTSGRRLQLWQASWNMGKDHPLQGVGLDNFLYQYPRYRLPGAGSEPFLSHPHNVVLDFWLSLGVLGLLWLGWAIVTIVRVIHRCLGAVGQEQRALALGITASLVVGVLHGFVDNSYFLPDLAVLFWLALAGLQLLLPGLPRPTAGELGGGL
ncbi:MAG: O-antigen ligase family protein [Chloroflexota bacterium]